MRGYHFVLDYYFRSLGTEKSLSTAAVLHVLLYSKSSSAENSDSAVRRFRTTAKSDY